MQLTIKQLEAARDRAKVYKPGHGYSFFDNRYVEKLLMVIYIIVNEPTSLEHG
jgi:hypothetical protein